MPGFRVVCGSTLLCVVEYESSRFLNLASDITSVFLGVCTCCDGGNVWGCVWRRAFTASFHMCTETTMGCWALREGRNHLLSLSTWGAAPPAGTSQLPPHQSGTSGASRPYILRSPFALQTETRGVFWIAQVIRTLKTGKRGRKPSPLKLLIQCEYHSSVYTSAYTYGVVCFCFVFFILLSPNILLATIDFQQHLAFFHNIGFLFFFSGKNTEKNKEESCHLYPTIQYSLLWRSWHVFIFYFSSPFFFF